jgi:hypothetical protein
LHNIIIGVHATVCTCLIVIYANSLSHYTSLLIDHGNSNSSIALLLWIDTRYDDVVKWYVNITVSFMSGPAIRVWWNSDSHCTETENSIINDNIVDLSHY